MNKLSINTRFRGVHSWPQCPIEDVRFLKTSHHHEFDVLVEVEVGSDRALEFIQMQCLVDSVVMDLYPNYNSRPLYKNIVVYTADLGSRSCEKISEEIARALVDYLEASVIVFVSEDGHYGSSFALQKEIQQ